MPLPPQSGHLESALSPDRRHLVLLVLALSIVLGQVVGKEMQPADYFRGGICQDRSTANSDMAAELQNEPRMAIFLFQPVPLNSADTLLLTSVDGIGPKLAARIISYRAGQGGFSSMVELMNVKGIGPQKFALLRNRFTL